MARPQTFREIREQVDRLGEELENFLINTRQYDSRRTDLDIECGQLVQGREALLDAAPEMLQILEAILSDEGVDRLQAFTINGEFRDPRETISAVIAKAKGETA